ncbi:hypothetical protein [Actinoplanes sp. NPDC026619]|uniref:hypothetical protein n=1 Tax=Actinoplanes sp. NPDC026619 TaxID=3155798 RepID=UPI0033F81941
MADTVLAWTAFQASVHAVGLDVMSEDRLACDREYVVLPADRFPHIRSVAEHLSEVDREDQFELTLQLVLDAAEARGARGGNPSGSARGSGPGDGREGGEVTV